MHRLRKWVGGKVPKYIIIIAALDRLRNLLKRWQRITAITDNLQAPAGQRLFVVKLGSLLVSRALALSDTSSPKGCAGAGMAKRVP